MASAMRKVLVVAMAVAGCSESGGSGKPSFDDTGSPSKTADELMAKHDATTSDGIAGVYELTDDRYDYNDNFEQFTNHVTRRVELRDSKLVVLLRCDINFDEPTLEDRSIQTFARLDAQVTDDGYEILESATQERYDASSMASCDLDVPRAAWAFCETKHFVEDDGSGAGSDDNGSGGSDDGRGEYLAIPSNATECIGLEDRRLVHLSRESGGQDDRAELGAKVAD